MLTKEMVLIVYRIILPLTKPQVYNLFNVIIMKQTILLFTVLISGYYSIILITGDQFYKGKVIKY